MEKVLRVEDGKYVTGEAVTGQEIKSTTITATTNASGYIATDLNIDKICILDAHTYGYSVAPVEYPSGKWSFYIWGILSTGAFVARVNASVTVNIRYIERSSTP